jgi:hypothetical protein
MIAEIYGFDIYQFCPARKFHCESPSRVPGLPDKLIDNVARFAKLGA